MSNLPVHRIQLNNGAFVPGTQALIELRLGVKTEVRLDPHGWGVYFEAPADVDLDFLRPCVLPPKDFPGPAVPQT